MPLARGAADRGGGVRGALGGAMLNRLAGLSGAAALGLLIATGALAPPPASGPVALGTSGPLASAISLDGESPPTTDRSAAALPEAGGPRQQRDATSAGTTATRLVLPRLGIDLPIEEGDGYGARLGYAAHFPTSGWPGGRSLIYLYGHAREANLIALWEAKTGDRVELHLDGGSVASYTVSRILPRVRWDDLSWLDPTPGEILRLQTCTSYGQTAPRFIVEAEPAGASR